MLRLGLGNINGAKRRQDIPSWLLNKLLFFGYYFKISDGKMPNEVGDDYLTVSGSTGSETYQVPNTAAYIAADTDYIWFKTDETQRTTTTAELVGYDLQRTPVKYEDSSPYAISKIMILKAGETLSADELNSLHQYMRLSIYFSGTLNAYGYLKENKGLEHHLWTPESVYEAETDALLTRMEAQPSVALAELIDKTIADLKTSEIWARLDVIRFYGLHTPQASLLNWIGNYSNASIVNDCAHTPKVGFTIDTSGGGRYLNSNYNPTTNGTNYKQDDAMFGAYTPTEVAIGAWITGVGSSYIWPRSSSGLSYRIRTPINPTGAPNQGLPGTSIGLSCAERVSSTHYRSVKNGSLGTDVADVSTAIPNANFNEGNSGAWPGVISEVHYGGSLTTAQHLTFYNIIKYFIDNVGGTF